MKKIIYRIAAAVMAAGMLFAPALPASDIIAVSVSAETSSSSAATPKADQKSGFYLMDGKYFKVNLSCKTKKAEIYYKIDSGKYQKYTKTIGLTKSSVITAYAKANGKKSKTVKFTYELGANFSLSSYGGNYTENQLVKVSTKVPNVTFRYTLNGQPVTEKSKKFPENGLSIENTASLTVMAYKKGCKEVGYTDLEYNINKLGNYKTDFYYNQLNKNEKEAYKRYCKALARGDKKADFSGLKLNEESAKKLHKAVQGRDISCQYADSFALHTLTGWDWENNECIAFNIDYDVKDKNNKKLQKKLDEKTAQIVANAKKQPTAYGKIKYIHDWIVNNTEYILDSDECVNTADGPLLYGKAVCGGYAAAFNRLAKSLGFDCIYVYNEGHAWNKIKLDDKWYNVDVTWDDMSLYGDKKIYYNNFLKSDKTFEKTKEHKPNSDFKYPAANEDYPIK